eukprot:CAMPEP_0176309058 /NCGR_PEP_ID=MMETSP0121_2-20121125/64876_1 /TAXON_ID=160619 /ORGANISM="Kryptoperidinium foliaceum, Strain CCMP 1326" /LENGTH=200 /DNA_ID=CAMNT_0017650935 /DNA_START=100 /DNA_END=703 /DNA_ORIENTATION=+
MSDGAKAELSHPQVSAVNGFGGVRGSLPRARARGGEGEEEERRAPAFRGHARRSAPEDPEAPGVMSPVHASTDRPPRGCAARKELAPQTLRKTYPSPAGRGRGAQGAAARERAYKATSLDAWPNALVWTPEACSTAAASEAAADTTVRPRPALANWRSNVCDGGWRPNSSSTDHGMLLLATPSGPAEALLFLSPALHWSM